MAEQNNTDTPDAPIDTITLHTLWGQYKQRYQGEHAPELLLAWDEYTVEANHEGWTTAVDEALQRYRGDIVDHGFLNIEVPLEAVLDLFETKAVAAVATSKASKPS